MVNFFYSSKASFYVYIIIISLLLCSCTTNSNNESENSNSNIENGKLRKEVFALVSSAENSTLDYSIQYSYIQDIGDGRGYTAGIIGFTSATGDLLEVVEKYAELKSSDNILEKYIPILKEVVGSDSIIGLGELFISDWELAANDIELIQAQDIILYNSYLHPAVEFANEDKLSILGQYIYYDALVVHGPGEDDEEESFNGIRSEAKKLSITPDRGGSEKEYLLSFLKARILIMEKEEAHSDLSRINTQIKFLNENNFNLTLPIQWVMYNDNFELTQDKLNKMK